MVVTAPARSRIARMSEIAGNVPLFDGRKRPTNAENQKKKKKITNSGCSSTISNTASQKETMHLNFFTNTLKSSGPNLTALNRVKLAVVENLAEIVASNVLSSVRLLYKPTCL